jgi:hypothetical protein
MSASPKRVPRCGLCRRPGHNIQSHRNRTVAAVDPWRAAQPKTTVKPPTVRDQNDLLATPGEDVAALLRGALRAVEEGSATAGALARAAEAQRDGQPWPNARAIVVLEDACRRASTSAARAVLSAVIAGVEAALGGLDADDPSLTPAAHLRFAPLPTQAKKGEPQPWLAPT